MLSFSDEVRRIEDRLKAAGVPVDDLCRDAGINRSTWTRWKYEKTWPRQAVWRRVVAAADAATDQSAAA